VLKRAGGLQKGTSESREEHSKGKGRKGKEDRAKQYRRYNWGTG
jgi:hypothetical protein